jgi:hypothetical protein
MSDEFDVKNLRPLQAGVVARARGYRNLRALRDVAWARGQEFGSIRGGHELLDGTHAFDTEASARRALDWALETALCAPLPPRWRLVARHFAGVALWHVILEDDLGRDVGRL